MSIKTKETIPMKKATQSKHFTFDRNHKIVHLKFQEPERDALEQLREMVQKAVRTMEEILKDPKAPDKAKLQIITMILDRTYGKPDETLKVQNDTWSVEESMKSIQEMIERIREKHHMNSRCSTEKDENT